MEICQALHHLSLSTPRLSPVSINLQERMHTQSIQHGNGGRQPRSNSTIPIGRERNYVPAAHNGWHVRKCASRDNGGPARTGAAARPAVGTPLHLPRPLHHMALTCKPSPCHPFAYAPSPPTHIITAHPIARTNSPWTRLPTHPHPQHDRPTHGAAACFANTPVPLIWPIDRTMTGCSMK